MRVFLIRHGETEHNVAGLLAGATDSILTNHGLNQAQRLGQYLVKTRSLQFAHVFASDLQRAANTAREITSAQNTVESDLSGTEPTIVKELREQDFGSFELVSWSKQRDTTSRRLKAGDDGFQPKESKEQMAVRADIFLDDYLLPLLPLDEDAEQNVAVVSHGLFLASLWRALLCRFKPMTVTFGPTVRHLIGIRPVEFLSSWSNTGYLEIEVRIDNTFTDTVIEGVSPLSTDRIDVEDRLNAKMLICAVNSTEHLIGLKRTRGGVGSSVVDDKQKKLDTFFKKPKTTE